MKNINWSPLERAFLSKNKFLDKYSKIPYLTVDNFPDLGLLMHL